MKTHSTNYQNAFISVAEDCPVSNSEVPPKKGDKRSIANIHYDIISKNPYQHTSDDVVFQAYAEKNDLIESEYSEARAEFFSKGQACLRCSPLVKRYGWGIHHDSEGKIALIAKGSSEYEKFQEDENLKQLKGMRSKR